MQSKTDDTHLKLVVLPTQILCYLKNPLLSRERANYQNQTFKLNTLNKKSFHYYSNSTKKSNYLITPTPLITLTSLITVYTLIILSPSITCCSMMSLLMFMMSLYISPLSSSVVCAGYYELRGIFQYLFRNPLHQFRYNVVYKHVTSHVRYRLSHFLTDPEQPGLFYNQPRN